MASSPTKSSVQVNIHGTPPKPNMEEPPALPDQHLSPSTLAEMEAGRQALKAISDRTLAEMEGGRKAVAEAEARLRREVTREGKEDKPSPP